MRSFRKPKDKKYKPTLIRCYRDSCDSNSGHKVIGGYCMKKGISLIRSGCMDFYKKEHD